MLATMEVLPVRHVTLDSLPLTKEPSIVKPAPKVTQLMATVKPNVLQFQLQDRQHNQLHSQQCVPLVKLNMEPDVHLVVLEITMITLVEFAVLVL